MMGSGSNPHTYTGSLFDGKANKIKYKKGNYLNDSEKNKKLIKKTH